MKKVLVLTIEMNKSLTHYISARMSCSHVQCIYGGDVSNPRMPSCRNQSTEEF